MKKIILLIMALFTVISITAPAWAYETGSNILTNNSYTVTYASNALGSGTAIKISISLNGDAIGYDTLIISGIYNVTNIEDTSTMYSGIGQGYSPQVNETDRAIYYQGQTQPILRPANVVKTLNEPIKANTVIELYYFYNISGGPVFEYIKSAIQTNVSIILITGGASYSAGYAQALKDSEMYYNNKIQQMQDIMDSELSSAYDLARNEYAIYYNGEWLTAQQWGDMQYQLGIQANPNENALAVMLGGVASIFGTGLAFILQLGSIELMGISLNMILGIGLLLVGLIAILGLIFGGK